MYHKTPEPTAASTKLTAASPERTAASNELTAASSEPAAASPEPISGRNLAWHGCPVNLESGYYDPGTMTQILFVMCEDHYMY